MKKRVCRIHCVYLGEMTLFNLHSCTTYGLVMIMSIRYTKTYCAFVDWPLNGPLKGYHHTDEFAIYSALMAAFAIYYSCTMTDIVNEVCLVFSAISILCL